MYDFDVDTVVAELKDLIERYPNNTGKHYEEDNYGQEEGLCFYFFDQDGERVSANTNKTQQLAVPSCIVGTWVHEFHPELKEDIKFSQLLRENASVRGFFDHYNEAPLSNDVVEVLANAQNQQDCVVGCWGEIDFSKQY